MTKHLMGPNTGPYGPRVARFNSMLFCCLVHVLRESDVRANTTQRPLQRTTTDRGRIAVRTLNLNTITISNDQLGQRGRENGVEIGIENGIENRIEIGVEIGIENEIEIGTKNGVENGIEIENEIKIKMGWEMGSKLGSSCYGNTAFNLVPY